MDDIKAEHVPHEAITAYIAARSAGAGPSEIVAAIINAWPQANSFFNSLGHPGFVQTLVKPGQAIVTLFLVTSERDNGQ